MNNTEILDMLNKAKLYGINLCTNGLYYVNPDYKFILPEYGVSPNDNVSWTDIREVLDLEVKRLNSMDERGPFIKELIYKIITAEEVDAVKDSVANDVLRYVKDKAKPEPEIENKYGIKPLDYSAR